MKVARILDNSSVGCTSHLLSLEFNAMDSCPNDLNDTIEAAHITMKNENT